MPNAQSIDFDPTADYYGELGVKADASADEIKRVYRQLARMYHPDSTGGDKAKESRFKAISVAYDVIGNPPRRKQYDAIRAGQNLRESIFDFFGFGRPSDDPGPEAAPEPEPYEPPTTSPFEGFNGFQMTETLANDGSVLRVEGVDVHSEVTISFDRAILGTTATVATLDGQADVKIPPGSPSGRKLRLRGKGLRNPAGLQGDHHITVQITVPTELDEESKHLLEQLIKRLKRRR